MPRAHNLPAQTSTFVSRELTADISRVLDRTDCRLLTLIGPGGAGKTRLAIEVAEGDASKFKHGVWFVPLAPLNRAEEIAASIASSLGLASSDTEEADERLLAFLRSRELLLVLDNFEHLLDGTPLLARILQTAPGIRLLVTSRQRLNVRDEWTVPVGAMHLPRDGEAFPGDGGDAMERYSALRLFQQSARRAKPGIVFGGDDVPIAAQICERVGAVPLAIELAAGWVRTLSLSEISREVAGDLDFLTGPKDAPARHGSIRAVFRSSWKLLSADEQDALRRSSVFRGGFGREAAHEVLGASLAVLSALVDKFLLHRDADGRYWRHVLIEGFVREEAAAHPDEVAEMEERHSRYYFDLLLRHDRLWKGRKQHEGLTAIDSDMQNVRSAWAWAVAKRHENALDRVMPSLEDVYTLQGRFQEGEASFALAASSLHTRSLTWGRVCMRQGRFCLLLGRYERAKALLEKGLSLFRQYNALADAALALKHLGVVLYYQGAYTEAEPRLQESLGLYRKLDDPTGIANSLNNLGNIAEMLGDYDAARLQHREALALRRETGEHRLVAVSLVNLGDVAYRAGDIEEARAFYEESLSLRQEIGDHGRLAGSLARLGDVALATGDAVEAEALCRSPATHSGDVRAPLDRASASWHRHRAGARRVGGRSRWAIGRRHPSSRQSALVSRARRAPVQRVGGNVAPAGGRGRRSEGRSRRLARAGRGRPRERVPAPACCVGVGEADGLWIASIEAIPLRLYAFARDG
jgi:predicted ATPase